MKFVYLLKNKFQTPEIFQSFITFIQNQTGKKIKAFRSDNGTEYVTQKFLKYYKNMASCIKHLFQEIHNKMVEQNALTEYFYLKLDVYYQTPALKNLFGQKPS